MLRIGTLAISASGIRSGSSAVSGLVVRSKKAMLLVAISVSGMLPLSGQAAEKAIIAPGADASVQEALQEKWRSMGDDYQPRTEHFLDNGDPKYINRLMVESSPYLLQHAHNPVNWYPWGDEAFAIAKSEEKPIFLSIGYATCHWCHVMERESFEDEAIAELMNKYFISIKVDREQLPDVDALFMTAVTMMTGRGGWPMSSFLDPDGRPFFGGTYFPPDQFTSLLDRVSLLWATEHDAILEQANTISNALQSAHTLSEQVQSVGDDLIKRAASSAVSRFDEEFGGFSRAPKFPQESTLLFLMEQARLSGDGRALEVAEVTLTKMAAGGIHDQIGGGFHRYSVDHEWLVPHFEKMLYNQANLARAYVLGWLLTGKQDHAETARGILEYVLREMTNENGVFYSATDADSEGGEGIFFIWDNEDLEQALTPEDASIAAELWGVDEVGNFEGHTVLHRPQSLEEIAKERGVTVDEMRNHRSRIAALLWQVRAKREAPIRDDKILTGWNGLMITAFAEAYQAFDEPRYLAAATRAANHLLDTAFSDQGQLQRSQFNGVTSIDAKQVDYAWLAQALLALYDSSGDKRWLTQAVELTDTMIELFRDVEGGGFFMGPPVVSGASLVTRPKDLYDASTPSGNAVALRVLARLYARTGEARYESEAQELIDAFSASLNEQSGGFYYFLTSVSELLNGETGQTRYAAKGIVRAQAQLISDQQVAITIDLEEGWHINSAKPLQDYLIATAVTDQQQQPLKNIRYPEPTERVLGFQSETLSLYDDGVVITAELPVAADNTPLVPIELRLQACSDEICLAPETLTLHVSTLSL